MLVEDYHLMTDMGHQHMAHWGEGVLSGEGRQRRRLPQARWRLPDYWFSRLRSDVITEHGTMGWRRWSTPVITAFSEGAQEAWLKPRASHLRDVYWAAGLSYRDVMTTDSPCRSVAVRRADAGDSVLSLSGATRIRIADHADPSDVSARYAVSALSTPGTAATVKNSTLAQAGLTRKALGIFAQHLPLVFGRSARRCQ